ncbi:MAG: glutamine-hydrolyzing GMP synthase [Thaumarchaeota archaeon]|nr:glutamine-hydrolyzing GMP synthase [Nitrososphaerota archaeon]
MTDRITVLDFGSQYSHLICRRIRDLSVYAELVPYDITAEELARHDPKGIILSGGPASVSDGDAPIPEDAVFESGLPILGICYGHQLIVHRYGGRVKRANREYGSSTLTVDGGGAGLLGGIGGSVRAWMSHGDEAEQVPRNFEVIGHTENSRAAAIASRDGPPVYGIQFHPEVAHTEQGSRILENFVLNVCKASRDWTMSRFVEEAVGKISGIEGNVLCGVSGGVDSTVAAVLIHRAIGERLKCVFVDNGLLREGESREITGIFRDNFGMNFEAVDAAQKFLGKLRGVADPEAKRKIVGEEFVRVFSDFAESRGPFRWLAQGTLYPDVIESGVSKGPASVIKSHHNVGGLPEWLDLEVLEPLRDLYKDEVREVARILGVPRSIYMRHPFPGPGLAVRIMGEVTPEKLKIARVAGKIVEDELGQAGLYSEVWQAYAAVGDDRAVGVVGDGRVYGNIVMIRVVSSTDAMTADWTRLPHDLLEKMSNRITNEIDNVTWVSYAVSSKPPATIEPQ